MLYALCVPAVFCLCTVLVAVSCACLWLGWTDCMSSLYWDDIGGGEHRCASCLLYCELSRGWGVVTVNRTADDGWDCRLHGPCRLTVLTELPRRVCLPSTQFYTVLRRHSHPPLGLARHLFPSVFPSKSFAWFSQPSVRATSPPPFSPSLI